MVPNCFFNSEKNIANGTMKILMLHGHEQSAQIFKPKARYIEAAFQDLVKEPGISVEFQYLSGILPAFPDRTDDHERWVWGYGDPDDGEINKLELSVQHILKTLDRDGPFVGIIGFSSGAAMAAIITSLLEKGDVFSNQQWTTRHAKLTFAICLSGFRLLGPLYERIYYPQIHTPILLAIGTQDPVVPPEKTQALADKCHLATIFEFPGVHYVPQLKEYPAFRKALADFLSIALISSQVDTATSPTSPHLHTSFSEMPIQTF